MFLPAADNTSPSAYLAVQPFEDVVRPDVEPVFTGEPQVGQRLPYALRVYVCGRVLLHFAELAFHIPGLGECRVRIFLGIGGLEKDGHGGEPHRSSVTSSTRRTDTPARYISMRDSSTDDSLRR